MLVCYNCVECLPNYYSNSYLVSCIIILSDHVGHLRMTPVSKCLVHNHVMYLHLTGVGQTQESRVMKVYIGSCKL